MQKLITTFFVMLAIAAVITLGLGYYAQQTVSRSATHTAKVLRENYDSVRFMDHVLDGLGEEDRAVLSHLATTGHQQSLVSALLPLKAQIDKGLSDELGNITLPDEGAASRRLVAAADRYHKALFAFAGEVDETTQSAQGNDPMSRLERYGREVEPLMAEAKTDADGIRQMNHDWMEKTARIQAASAPHFILLGTIVAVSALLAGGLQLSRRLHRQATELQALRTHFVAIASHELRTPVTSLKMALDLLTSEAVGALNSEQRAVTEAGAEDCDRLLALSRQLLDVTKIQSGQLEMRPVSTELRPLVSDCVTGLRRTVQEKRITVDLDVDLPQDTCVEADPVKAAWVITNLLTNALRHAPVEGNVKVSARLVPVGHLGKREVAVSVSDTGPGIAPEIAHKVFHPYFQAHTAKGSASKPSDTKRSANVGLGLAIAQEIVAAHGGRIWVEPTPFLGRGATLTFTLPLARAEA